MAMIGMDEHGPDPFGKVADVQVWIVMLALQFSKPGRYYLSQIRINYLADGKPGWQDQNLHLTIYEIRGFNNGSPC
jgi:hypothetical protein